MIDTAGLAHVEVSGFAHPPFEPLADVFARVVAAQLGGGAALAIYQDGELLVDLVGGDYSPDSLQLQFSVSKAVTAIAAQHASHEGLLDLDAPIGDYWPEFRRARTAQITPRMVLSHRSGLAGVSRALTVEEVLRGEYTKALEEQDPFWEPGQNHGYHTFSFGPLMDGVFVRSVGRTVSEYVDRHLARPLGLDLWLGIPDAVFPRVMPYHRKIEVLTPLQYAAAVSGTAFVDAGFKDLSADWLTFNRRDVLKAGWPSTNVVSGARDMAKLFASTLGPVEGVRVVSQESLVDMIATQAVGRDWVLGIPIRFGSGVQLAFPQLPYIGPQSFGHEGAGGTMAFADPESGLAVAMITNAFPVSNGASIGALTLASTIRHLVETHGQ